MNSIVNTKRYKVLNKIFYVIEFYISIFVGILLFQLICDKMYFYIVKAQKIILFTLLLFILITMIIIKLKKEHKCYEKIFLTLMIPIGIFYLIFVIPGQVPDEQNHITRACDISQGNFVMNIEEQKQHVPLDISKMSMQKMRYDTFIERMQIEQDYTRIDQEGKYNPMCSYFPIVYLAVSIGLKIGISLNCNMFLTIYFARILNFIVALAVGYYSIKIIPMGKLLLFTYLFNPIYIQQSISCSADCFINAFIILFISYTMHLMLKKEEMSIKDKIIYAMLFLLAFLNKTVYYPISFISFLLIKVKNKKSEKYFVITCMIILTIFTIFWGIFVMNYKDVRETPMKNNVNSKEQIRYILANPIDYIEVMVNTIKQQGVAWGGRFLGAKLGCSDILCPLSSCIVLATMLILAPLLENNKKALNVKQKVYVIFITFSTLVLIITALYLIWSPVGGEVIQGIQGRYFIPVVILLLLCLIMSKEKKNFKYTEIAYIILIILINIISIYCIVGYLSIPNT